MSIDSLSYSLYGGSALKVTAYSHEAQNTEHTTKLSCVNFVVWFHARMQCYGGRVYASFHFFFISHRFLYYITTQSRCDSVLVFAFVCMCELVCVRLYLLVCLLACLLVCVTLHINLFLVVYILCSFHSHWMGFSNV